MTKPDNGDRIVFIGKDKPIVILYIQPRRAEEGRCLLVLDPSSEERRRLRRTGAANAAVLADGRGVMRDRQLARP